MLYPYKMFLETEYSLSKHDKEVKITNELAHAFTKTNNNSSYDIRLFMEEFFKDEKNYSELQTEILGLGEVADEWSYQRLKAKKLLFKLGIPENALNSKYYRGVEKETIIKDLKIHGIEVDEKIKISKMPGARIMEYSHFDRVHTTKRPIKPNDVMDVKISCIAPYVDAVITEKYQAEIYKKAKSFINDIKNLKIFKINDFEDNKS